MNIAFFDFDGTITSKDSMIDFILFSVGYKKFIISLITLFPALVAYKLKIIPNWRVKEIVIKTFFGGWDISRLNSIASRYSEDRLPYLIRNEALLAINKHKSNNDKIVVVTGSSDIWVKQWCDVINLELISTKLEIVSGCVTGKLSSRNCYGIEKVLRIRENYSLENYNFIYAYGNSDGDKEMLDIADIKYFKWKKINSLA